VSASAAKDQRVAPARRDRGEQAELVAAHPVDAPQAVRHGFQALGKADEQRIAGGMAEAVVVLLEAIEVEEREHALALVVGAGQLRLQVVDQRAAVAQARERIGECLPAAGRQQSLVLTGEIGGEGARLRCPPVVGRRRRAAAAG
jgi:hypothetical protein